MHMRVNRQAPLILGLFGGVLGLISTYELASVLFGLAGCYCPLNLTVGIFFWPGAVGSVIGLAGCLVFSANRAAGGALLLSGGLIVSSAAVLEMSLWFGLLFFLLIPNLFFGLILTLAGLLAFPRTRSVIMKLHNGGWIP